MTTSIEEIFPLSPMQQGLLFHSLSAPDPAVYTVQVCCTIEGDLDCGAFQSAWQAVTDLHPALRSDFDWEELDEPVQVVHRSLRAAVECRGEEDLEGFLAEDRRRPFQLSEAPLLRLSLLRAGTLRHLVWTYHHLLLDGWSALLVLGQVFAAYAALRQGRPPALVPPRRFSDYVAWLRRLDREAAAAFWRRELRGFGEPTPLPVRLAQDGPGTAGRAVAALAPDLTAALRSFARQHRLTLNTLVQGAWALALGRAAGEEEVLFGATVSGRPPELAGADSMVGLFLNTLPVRVPVPPTAALASWLADLQARQVAVRQAQYVPLAAIQGWSELPRDRPLFDSLLIYENHPVSA
ncbi:MAG TPA: condensation domain-containing protein, partial [Thermoanaerobaculia bacterium]|nr:condensation domain-containing protein [Thermoanaerobaculia bacterium]